eukprot:TRINITY_DN7749_c0_g1_i1.p1 TRINITY_DN7749_c0_g1~~TRINITY_DN7749_c0_g1_i1.p1  ORF type:complete len:398 (+),score=79.36 TRINITY_DN7749_c0_g1_i1:129-1322(+)
MAPRPTEGHIEAIMADVESAPQPEEEAEAEKLPARAIAKQVSFAAGHSEGSKREERTPVGLPSLSRRSRSSISLVSSVPSALSPMPGIRNACSVREFEGLLENHYTVSKTLGKGAYGVVYEVVQRKTGELRALKSISFEKLEDPGAFKDELAIARQLDHPYIVRLYEVFQTGECVHLVMELCSNGTLSKMLADANNAAIKATGRSTARARLPNDLIGKFMWQMLSGIAYLHHHRIIHRDVKPENYLVQTKSPNIFLKLADFGLACFFKKGRPLKDILGTPCYVAPEVLCGRYDERCDIWSIGVVCFVLCIGHHPFARSKGDTAKVVLKRIRDKEIAYGEDDWESICPEAKRHTLQMMEWDAEKRPRAKQIISGSTWLRGHEVPYRGTPVKNSCCVVS